jgi:hypothetical protein
MGRYTMRFAIKSCSNNVFDVFHAAHGKRLFALMALFFLVPSGLQAKGGKVDNKITIVSYVPFSSATWAPTSLPGFAEGQQARVTISDSKDLIALWGKVVPLQSTPAHFDPGAIRLYFVRNEIKYFVDSDGNVVSDEPAFYKINVKEFEPILQKAINYNPFSPE